MGYFALWAKPSVRLDYIPGLGKMISHKIKMSSQRWHYLTSPLLKPAFLIQLQVVLDLPLPPLNKCQKWLCGYLSTRGKRGCLLTVLCKYINTMLIWYFFLKILFLERGRVGERLGEKHQWVVASHMPPTGNLACNPGMFPNWGRNWQPFDSQAHAQATELHQLGQIWYF